MKEINVSNVCALKSGHKENGYSQCSRVHSKLSSPRHRKAVPSACCCTLCRWNTPRGRLGPWLCNRCLLQQHSPRSGHSVLSPEGKDSSQSKTLVSAAEEVPPLTHGYRSGEGDTAAQSPEKQFVPLLAKIQCHWKALWCWSIWKDLERIETGSQDSTHVSCAAASQQSL